MIFYPNDIVIFKPNRKPTYLVVTSFSGSNVARGYILRNTNTNEILVCMSGDNLELVVNTPKEVKFKVGDYVILEDEYFSREILGTYTDGDGELGYLLRGDNFTAVMVSDVTKLKKEVLRKIGGTSAPAPLYSKPEYQTPYWAPSFLETATKYYWKDSPKDNEYLDSGLCFSSYEGAVLTTKVLRLLTTPGDR